MKALTKILLFAAVSAAALCSCNKLPENEVLNPKGTPVKLTLSGDKAFSGPKAAIKVTADVPAPADITVKLALDASATVKAENVTFPSLVIKEGETEASGYLELDPTGLKPGTTFKVVVVGSVAGVEFGPKVELSYTTDPEEEEPDVPVVTPSAIKIDGDFSDWDSIKGISSEDGPVYAVKATTDANNIYFYVKREINNTGLWGGGYYYFDIDIDNNPNTGTEKDSITGLETWMYLYYFLGSADAPEIATAPEGELWTGGEGGSSAAYTCAAGSCNGKINEDNTVDIEIVLPLADLGLKIGDDVTIYTWGNKSGSNLKSEPLYLKVKENGGADEPVAQGITIDGDFADWASIKGISSEDGPVYTFKATNDATYAYFYVKREINNTGLWGGGYYYFDIDIDSNPNTGTEKDSITGLETWIYLYYFLGSADAPEIANAPEGELWTGGEGGSSAAYTCAADSCKGKINEDNTVEVEIALPLADLGLKVGDDTTIYTWGNKSGSNLKSEPLYLKIK